MNYTIDIFELERLIHYHLDNGTLPQNLVDQVKLKECPLLEEQNIHIMAAFDRFAIAYISLAQCYGHQKHEVVKSVFARFRDIFDGGAWTVETTVAVLALAIQGTVTVNGMDSLFAMVIPENFMEETFTPFPYGGVVGQA